VNESEYLLLMNEYINTSFMLVGVLLSLISAFLLVSYLAADKFNRVVSGMLVLMYSIAYFWIGGACINGNNHIRNFADRMRSTDFDFSYAKFMDLEIEISIANAVVIASYFFSIFFFFYVRNQDRHGRRPENNV